MTSEDRETLAKQSEEEAYRRLVTQLKVEADRKAAEDAERAAEREIFHERIAKLGESRRVRTLRRLRHTLFFLAFSFVIYVTVVLILSSMETDFPFFNGSVIIYASVYFIIFLIYFHLARGED